MTILDLISFKVRAGIGRILAETYYKNSGKKLNAITHRYHGTINIEWVHIGTGERDTLLFLHGFSDRKENFYFTSKTLSNNLDIIIPDMPGFGQSTKDYNLKYSLEHYVDWLGEFIEHLPVENFHLAGNSLGGAVSAMLAERFPDKIISLILIDSFGFYMPGWESIYDEALEGKNLFHVESEKDFNRLRDIVFFNKPKFPLFVKEYMVKDTMDNRDWYDKIFYELVDLDLIRKREKTPEALSLNALCPHIKMPTLILWGNHDSIFPYHIADFIKERIPDSQMHIFDKVGHCPHLEAPEALAREVAKFLKR